MFKTAFCLVFFFVGLSVSAEAEGTCGSVVAVADCSSEDATRLAVTHTRRKSACVWVEPRKFSVRPVNFCRINETMADVTATPHAAAPNPFGDVFAFPMPRYEAEWKAAEAKAKKDEDLTNPLSMAHAAERIRYSALYQQKYLGAAYVMNMPVPMGPIAAKPVTTLPPGTDSAGHQLWFDGRSGFAELNQITAVLFALQRFDDLDQLFKTWSDPSERTADGRWKLSAFEELFVSQSSEFAWNDIFKTIERWRSKSPKSTAAALAEAMYWQQRAWSARGFGAADAVAEDGWALYRERLERARQVLWQSAPYAGSSPLWGENLLSVETDLGWSEDKLFDLYQAETKREPQYIPVYNVVARAFTPKWGGSWQAVDVLARDAVDKTRHTDGNAMYARIYSEVAGLYEDPNIFKYTLARWADVKRGFEDLMRHYPHSASNLNEFAVMACMADDKATFASVRFAIGSNVVLDRWPSGYSLEVCEHKLLQRS